MKHILSVEVNNTSGVLSHVSGLFTRRGYNIDSLSVGETEKPDRSVITLVVNEDEEMIRQIEKQLYKLVDVIEVKNLTGEESLKRELVLLTVKSDQKTRADLINLVDVFDAKIVDLTNDAVMIEMSGIPRQVATFIQIMSELGILSMARTGSIALGFPDEA